jgi:hypothetical protein
LTYRQANQQDFKRLAGRFLRWRARLKKPKPELVKLADALDAAQTLRRECCFATRPSDRHQFANLNDQTDRTSAIQSDTLS